MNTEHRFQAIEGFGGAFTEAAAVTWLELDAQREELLDAYFDPDHGHGYTLCRVHMNSCDFALGNYAYAEPRATWRSRTSASTATGRRCCPSSRPRCAWPARPIKLLASPWSPPAWMKTNGQMNHGGKLQPEYRAAWARYYVRFVQEYAEKACRSGA